jgi:hypothetical protein
VDSVEGSENFLPVEAQGPDAERSYRVAVNLLGPLRRGVARAEWGTLLAKVGKTT